MSLLLSLVAAVADNEAADRWSPSSWLAPGQLHVTYFPGRDDCHPYYRPLRWGTLAFVVNCQWTMDNVRGVLQQLRQEGRKAILSDSFLLSRSDADMAVYRDFADVFACYYARDEPLWGALTYGGISPTELNQVIGKPEWQKRVDNTIEEVAQRIAKLKTISNTSVPIMVNEAKPILDIFDHNFNVSGNSSSQWSNFTLATVKKMHAFNVQFFERLGKDIDIYGQFG